MNTEVNKKQSGLLKEEAWGLVVNGPWQPPVIDDLTKIPTGDMPGDQVKIDDGHIVKAQAIYSELLSETIELMNKNPNHKVVISVHGGSGVGKSEIGALLAYYFNDSGVGSYVLSGDNYPRRIPHFNDAERLRIFRAAAIDGLLNKKLYNDQVKVVLEQLIIGDHEADPNFTEQYPWLETYQRTGRQGLANYLGSNDEVDFTKINHILGAFKKGNETIMLKRMGRALKDLWYEEVDFSEVNVLIIEWTHGNNPNLLGVDLPILLNSTPEETLNHRRLRNRDGGLDSPFTAMVLSIEQEKLHRQAQSAKMIVSKNSEILSYETYEKRMDIK